MNRLDLSEHETIIGVELSDDELRLVGASPGLQLAPSLAGAGRWDLSSTHYVGVIGGPTIEVRIRPKVDVATLMALIEYSREHPVWSPHTPDVVEGEDLGEWLARSFCRQADRALRHGILQGYVRREETQMALRGRLLIERQLARRFALPLPLDVAYDEFTTDIPENRLLRTAASRMLAVPGLSALVRGRLVRVRALLEGVAELPARAPVPAISFTRLNERYRPALDLARLILRSVTIEVGRGGRAGVAFLVNMNRVFEGFVSQALMICLTVGAQRVRLQHPDVLDEGARLRIIPDLSVWEDGRCTVVVDAKYKRLRAEGEAMPDDYQVLAYCTALGASLGVLVHADGAGHEAEHVVRGAGVRIIVRKIALDRPLPELLRRIAALSEQMRTHGRRAGETPAA